MSEHNVIIAVDKSTFSEKAFDWFIKSLYREDHQVIILHSAEMIIPVINTNPVGRFHLSSAAWDEAIAKSNRLAEEICVKYEAKIRESKIEANIKVIQGQPEQNIVRAAEEEQALFVVMGTRGMGVVRRTIMGSVSDYVLHHAHCPVVIYKE